MGLIAFNQVGGHVGLLFLYDSYTELIFAFIVIVNGILAGIACVGLWKVKEWTMRPLVAWAITMIPLSVSMKYLLEEYGIWQMFNGIHITIAVVLNIVIVILVLRYVNRVLQTYPNN